MPARAFHKRSISPNRNQSNCFSRRKATRLLSGFETSAALPFRRRGRWSKGRGALLDGFAVLRGQPLGLSRSCNNLGVERRPPTPTRPSALDMKALPGVWHDVCLSYVPAGRAGIAIQNHMRGPTSNGEQRRPRGAFGIAAVRIQRRQRCAEGARKVSARGRNRVGVGTN